MELQIISNIIQNIAVIVASFIAIHGINSWRREIKWKKKYELIEDVLVLFYEADEKLKILRNPGSFGNEGDTRKKGENETSEQTQSLNQQYVFYERWEREKDVFLKLQTLKFRFIAMFGKEFLQPFEKVRIILNEIFIANNRLNNKYWKDQGRVKMSDEEFKIHLEKMHEAEAKIWDSQDESDEIRIRMKNITIQIENLYNQILGRKFSISRK